MLEKKEREIREVESEEIWKKNLTVLGFRRPNRLFENKKPPSPESTRNSSKKNNLISYLPTKKMDAATIVLNQLGSGALAQSILSLYDKIEQPPQPPTESNNGTKYALNQLIRDTASRKRALCVEQVCEVADCALEKSREFIGGEEKRRATKYDRNFALAQRLDHIAALHNAQQSLSTLCRVVEHLDRREPRRADSELATYLGLEPKDTVQQEIRRFSDCHDIAMRKIEQTILDANDARIAATHDQLFDVKESIKELGAELKEIANAIDE